VNLENFLSKSEFKILNKQIKELNKKYNTKVKKLKEKKLEDYYKIYYIKKDIFIIRDFNILKSIYLNTSKVIKSLEKDPKNKQVKKL
jgi:predicted ribosome-associated RNA-binding protein Tma20